MTMTITEAHHVNRLAVWLLGPDSYETKASDDEALEALAYLAERANKALIAGVDRATVLKRWERAQPRVTRGRRKR